MSPALLYIIKAAFYIAAFYLVYSLFLSRDTQYARNRTFILVSVAASLVLPSITIQTGNPVNFPLFGRTLNEVLITVDRSRTGRIMTGLSIYQVLLLLYVIGVVLTALKMIFEFRGLLKIIAKSKSKGNRLITLSGLRTTAFTAFGHIFINDSLPPEVAGEVMRHEQNHLDKNHFFDIILMQFIKALQWFNPFIYMFDKALREVHEYQADEKCINTGTPVSSYQRLLLNQVLETRLFSISNSFSNPTLVKKRMIMMTKERSGLLANLKILMVLPVVAVVMLAFSSCGEKAKTNGSKKTEIQSTGTSAQPADSVNKAKTGEAVPAGDVAPPPPPPPPPPPVSKADTANAPFVMVDVMPEFPGGDQGLMALVAKNTRYPEEAKKNGITGKVIVRFAVETDGSIDKIAILKGVDPLLDAEAIRVVGTLPRFKAPGLIKGKPVAVWYMLPINYKLN